MTETGKHSGQGRRDRRWEEGTGAHPKAHQQEGSCMDLGIHEKRKEGRSTTMEREKKPMAKGAFCAALRSFQVGAHKGLKAGE